MKKENGQNKESASLRFLYHTVPGRVLLRLLTARWVSGVTGAFLSSSLSRFLVRPFLRKNGIDPTLYETDRFATFNDCFSRRILPEYRPVDRDPKALISPCDGLLTVYPIQDGTVLPVKQSLYSVSSLLRDEAAAERFRDGLCLVFRLCVDHYHRYCFPDDAEAGTPSKLNGVLHTVRPIALEQFPVFTENSREVTELCTAHFGRMMQIEVGAMFVGKIANHPGKSTVCRGEEKGTFLYGGSTIILLLEKDRAEILPTILSENALGKEYPVRYGARIGTSTAG